MYGYVLQIMKLVVMNLMLILFRGGSRTAATSKMERFLILSQSAPSWMLQQS